MPERIFISYASEDRDFARELFLALKARGFDPWMDKPPAPHQLEGILPGQDWRARITAEVQNADKMILILSPVSVEKVGYVQREFRLALEAMNELPPGQLFAIPILKEPCEVPNLVVGSVALGDLQWTEIFDVGIDHFIDALQAAGHA
jgi:hypothetical protein